MKMMKNLTVVFFASALIFTNINAQERNDVIKVYNEGAKSMQTDLPAAIQAFESVITISEQVGESADDLKQKAMQVLPGLYLKSANNVVKENKSVAEIVQAAKVAVAATDKYGTATHKETAKRLMVQAYNIMGTNYFTEKEYENALLAFDSLLIVDPDYSNAIYNKALVYRSQNNSEAFEEAIDLYLSKLAPGTDDERSKQASAMALEYFRAAGSQANQAENLDEALLLLNKAAKYGDDKDLFYFFADVYNKQSKFDSGVEYAQKGLEMETDDAEAKAKFYFQLGLAQAGKGQTAEACASFKNSLYGPFAEPSKAQRTNLKCQ
jgi:tetratricopeptide (TPR) repeat protein